MQGARMHADSTKGGFGRHSGVRSRGTRCDSRIHLLAVPIAPAVKISGRYSLSTRCPKEAQTVRMWVAGNRGLTIDRRSYVTEPLQALDESPCTTPPVPAGQIVFRAFVSLTTMRRRHRRRVQAY